MLLARGAFTGIGAIGSADESGGDSCARPGAAPGAGASEEIRRAAGRLKELLGSERETQAAFLKELGGFDRRRGWAELGYATAWEFCRRALRLQDGSIWKRLRSARVLLDFPAAEALLLDGRLSMTTLAMLADDLTEENAARLFEACSERKRSEVEAIVADERAPRPAPKEMIESTLENGRLLCRAHNEQHARNVFGDDVIERSKRRAKRKRRVA